MRVFRAIINDPKAVKAYQHERFAKPFEPLYETEADVTRAIAAGTFDREYYQTPNGYVDPYKCIKVWNDWLKANQPQQFFNKGKAKPRHGNYNHRMQFSH
jgi:hypothetical protein